MFIFYFDRPWKKNAILANYVLISHESTSRTAYWNILLWKIQMKSMCHENVLEEIKLKSSLLLENRFLTTVLVKILITYLLYSNKSCPILQLVFKILKKCDTKQVYCADNIILRKTSFSEPNLISLRFGPCSLFRICYDVTNICRSKWAGQVRSYLKYFVFFRNCKIISLLTHLPKSQGQVLGEGDVTRIALFVISKSWTCISPFWPPWFLTVYFWANPWDDMTHKFN